MSDEPTLYVIVGPTAVGKTAVALALAQEFGGEIISADSRQFYRGMDVATAKATPAEQALVPHHLLDVVNPDEELALATYQERAYAAIHDIFERGRIPFLVGGTGLYVRAVVQGYRIPAVVPNPTLRAELEQLPTPELFARLQALDPVAATTTQPNNSRRIIRALEVIEATGEPISAQQTRVPPPFRVGQIGLTLPRPILYERVDARIQQMLDAGLLDEVRGLVARGYAPNLPSMTGLGYREMGAVVRGETSLDEGIVLLKRNTRKFIRHQANWFQPNDSRIRWFDLSVVGIDEIREFVRADLTSTEDLTVFPAMVTHRQNLSGLRSDARAIFDAALRAADPRAAVLRVLTRDGNELRLNGKPLFTLGTGRLRVVGVGKAGAPMAQALEELLGDEIDVGAVLVKYGHVAPLHKIQLYEGGHPIPDANGLAATQAIVRVLADAQSRDLVLCVISGGGSALMEWLADGVTLDDLQVFTDLLLRSGATIYELNTLRKHISRVKGGQLARLAQPARVVALILSDVLGSLLEIIASGPTAPDPSTFSDCLAILDRYGLRERAPPSIRQRLEQGARGETTDTPKPGDALFDRVTNVIVADNQQACDAAADEATKRGYAVKLVSTMLQGEARTLGAEMATQALTLPRPACLLGGGEPTVTVTGHGKGGRAQEWTIAAAQVLAGVADVVALSAGTDGTDGPTDAAGAIADGTTIARATALDMQADAALADNDAYSFFRALGDLVSTGPTNTNVNDLMIVLTH